MDNSQRIRKALKAKSTLAHKGHCDKAFNSRHAKDAARFTVGQVLVLITRLLGVK